ncbi:polysaccharide deacetylase family protein [Streptomyces sp. NPDC051207]|uniref:polysaccharide deacetylase family protein n=1 Tax=Streptomyces sp. NPDC051207 TaxID=3154641 RepID=UPI00343FD051
MHKLPRLSLVALTASALLATLGASATAHATAPGDGPGARGVCRNGHVALTFDDGPAESTPRLLEALTANRLRATMFNTGSNAAARPDLVRAQTAAGMWVGNHSYTHPHMTQLPADQAYAEIADTQRVLTGILGTAPALFRPPYGETNDQLREQQRQLGLTEVLWTVDSRDWAGASAEEIVAAAATLRPGGIMLLHDWSADTLAAIPGIAKVLRTKGLCTGRIVPSAPSGEDGAAPQAVVVKP